MSVLKKSLNGQAQQILILDPMKTTKPEPTFSENERIRIKDRKFNGSNEIRILSPEVITLAPR